LVKLITIDLDGTLLDSGSKISEENRTAVRRCIDSGIKVTLCTGKSIQCSAKIIQELGLEDLHIVSGGAVVMDSLQKPVMTIRIPAESAKNVISLGRKNNVGVALGTTDGLLYYDRYYPEIDVIYRSGEVIEKVDDIMAEYIINNGLLFTITVDDTHPFNRILKENTGPDIKIRRGGPYFLNVLHEKAGKVAGLKKVLSLYEIDPKDVMAIGDSNNDVGIMGFAGLSVAMGNAPDQVKKIADCITADNDSSGVAKAIYDFAGLQ